MGAEVTQHARMPVNTSATGTPMMGGSAQIGESLTAGAWGISDADGLTKATFSCSGSSTMPTSAETTGSTYTPAVGDVGRITGVRVSFTDDGNAETLISAATAALMARPKPLTVVFLATPSSPLDESSASTFELRISEEFA